MWFERIAGFREGSAEQVRNNITIDGNVLTSSANGRSMICGELEIPKLAELRQKVLSSRHKIGKISVREIIADASQLHADEANKDSLFQVASQFNLLEMVSPTVTPEQGIDQYEHDHTQGPVCAVAAGAGTIYRNYFVNVNGKIGQTADNQINCLADVGIALGNTDEKLWHMSNGYVQATEDGLSKVTTLLNKASDSELDRLRGLLRIGIQWNTEVTIDNCEHTVSQAYCSALPVAYSDHAPSRWKRFAQLVLEASYEATICVAILNCINTDNNKLYLTLVGGGVFGNDSSWIMDAIERALILYNNVDLDVAIVSYGSSNADVSRLVDQF